MKRVKVFVDLVGGPCCGQRFTVSLPEGAEVISVPWSDGIRSMAAIYQLIEGRWTYRRDGEACH
jgi:hypothetical protein